MESSADGTRILRDLIIVGDRKWSVFVEFIQWKEKTGTISSGCTLACDEKVR